MTTYNSSPSKERLLSATCNFLVAFIALTQIFAILQSYYEISYYAIFLLLSSIFVILFFIFNINTIKFNIFEVAKILLLCGCYSYLNLIYDRLSSSLLLLFCLPCLILYVNNKIFPIVDGLVFWGCVLSFICYLGALLGLISGESVSIGDRSYFRYFFTLSDFDIYDANSSLQRFRFYGVADEPGRMGLFLAFSFIYNYKNMARSYFVLFLGAITFSTLFYGILSLYLLINFLKIENFKYLFNHILLIAVLFYIANIFIKDSELANFLIYKLSFLSVDSIFNRLNFVLLNDFFNSEDFQSVIFGRQYTPDAEYSFDSSVISLIQKLGLLGGFIYFLIILEFRIFIVMLFPLIFIRYNFIFTDVIFLYSLKEFYYDQDRPYYYIASSR